MLRVSAIGYETKTVKVTSSSMDIILAEEASELTKKKLSRSERQATIARLEKEMKAASKMLEFEYAALLRDQIIQLRSEE